MSQKTTFFIVTAVKTSNLTFSLIIPLRHESNLFRLSYRSKPLVFLLVVPCWAVISASPFAVLPLEGSPGIVMVMQSSLGREMSTQREGRLIQWRFCRRSHLVRSRAIFDTSPGHCKRHYQNRAIALGRTMGELCKIWAFHGGDYEEWCLLGCYAVWLL
jgi:hypothetical protein